MTIIQAFISCVLILFAPELIRISAPQSYSVGLVIIPIVVISYFLDYIGSIYTRYIVYEKKRIAILPIYGIVSGVINIGLNMVLIPLYGYKIASVTTLISYLILTILYIQLAYRRMPIEVMAIKEFIKYVIVLVIISLLFYVAYFIDINGVFSIILRFGVSLILFIYFYRIFIDGRKKV
jgi:O-antigen/teichoic acid export membrane protein